MKPDTFFVEIQLRDGTYFPFLVEGISFQEVEYRTREACIRQNARLVQVFNMDVWAYCHVPANPIKPL